MEGKIQLQKVILITQPSQESSSVYYSFQITHLGEDPKHNFFLKSAFYVKKGNLTRNSHMSITTARKKKGI